jgi:hypothetical protein
MEDDPITLRENDLYVERLWGLPGIADFLDVSVNTARRWARKEGTPIYKTGGRYWAVRSELWRWSRRAA